MPIKLSLTQETEDKLRAYAAKREGNLTKVAEAALQQFFVSEEEDPTRERALHRVISRKLALPTGFTYRAFWLNIYMLAQHYPDLDAKGYWGMVYLSSLTKTHRALFTEISEEWKQELKDVPARKK